MPDERRTRGVERRCSVRASTQAAAARAPVLHRQAARGHALVGPNARVGRQHLHALDREAEFVGRDLRQRRADALAELDLAGAHPHRAVGVELEPHGRPAPRAARHARCGCARRSGTGAHRARCARRHRWATAGGAAARPQRSACPSCNRRTAPPARRQRPRPAPSQPFDRGDRMPCTAHSGVLHAAVDTPSTSTWQAPHSPAPQPKRVPFRRARRAARRAAACSGRLQRMLRAVDREAGRRHRVMLTRRLVESQRLATASLLTFTS